MFSIARKFKLNSVLYRTKNYFNGLHSDLPLRIVCAEKKNLNLKKNSCIFSSYTCWKQTCKWLFDIIVHLKIWVTFAFAIFCNSNSFFYTFYLFQIWIPHLSQHFDKMFFYFSTFTGNEINHALWIVHTVNEQSTIAFSWKFLQQLGKTRRFKPMTIDCVCISRKGYWLIMALVYTRCFKAIFFKKQLFFVQFVILFVFYSKNIFF